MKLLVAIMSYRVTDLTIDCLRSLSRQIERVPGTKVAVCENGTGGDAAERLRQAIEENGWDSWVDLTVVYPNRGFTGGNNAVIRPALESDDPPEYVLLLNADTIVQDTPWIRWSRSWTAIPRPGSPGARSSRRTGRSRPRRFASRGSRPSWIEGCGWGSSRSCCRPGSTVLPKPKEACPVDWVSRGKPDPPADDAGADRAAGRGIVHIFR